MKKIIFFLYYLKETEVKKFTSYLDFASLQTGTSKVTLLLDVVRSVFRYDISLLDYFYFRFYEKNSTQRAEWAGTGYMYRFQLRMNPKVSRAVLAQKLLFLEAYKDFVKHPFASIDDVLRLNANSKAVLQNSSGKVVFKDSTGQCGYGIIIREVSSMHSEDIVHYMRKHKFDMLEAFVVQHDELMKLSPSGLNTIRVFSQLDANDEVVILGCRLRITINSHVDNMASGNMAAPIDEKTGIVTGPGVFSDIRKESCAFHPVTTIPIVGFQIPYWEATMSMVYKAAKLDVRNRSIGWDIAITNDGPELIEGNHNWCKLLWQLPVQKGMKSVLETF